MLPTLCPECGADVAAAAKACACGWRRAATGNASAAGRGDTDPEPWRCAHAILGRRCPNAGCIKRGALWLCMDHAGRGIGGGVCLPPGGFKALREIIKPIRERAAEIEADRERAAIQGEGETR